MFNLFKNFITASLAKDATEREYAKRQRLIRDAIEEDITRATKLFNYDIKYNKRPYSFSLGENISEEAKINFVIEHKEELEAMGYSVQYNAYVYRKSWSDESEKIEKATDYTKADCIDLTISWR